jgi:hypothetical protein
VYDRRFKKMNGCGVEGSVLNNFSVGRSKGPYASGPKTIQTL